MFSDLGSRGDGWFLRRVAEHWPPLRKVKIPKILFKNKNVPGFTRRSARRRLISATCGWTLPTSMWSSASTSPPFRCTRTAWRSSSNIPTSRWAGYFFKLPFSTQKFLGVFIHFFVFWFIVFFQGCGVWIRILFFCRSWSECTWFLNAIPDPALQNCNVTFFNFCKKYFMESLSWLTAISNDNWVSAPIYNWKLKIFKKYKIAIMNYQQFSCIFSVFSS